MRDSSIIALVCKICIRFCTIRCFHASTREFLRCVHTCMAYVHTCILLCEHECVQGKTTHEFIVSLTVSYGIAKRHTEVEGGEASEKGKSLKPVGRRSRL